MAMNSLREARKRLKLSLEQLSEDVGISVSQLSRFESGNREPRIKELARIAKRLNLSIGDLTNQSESNAVTVMGRIGAGAEILPEFEQIDEHEGLFSVETVLDLPQDVIAFEVDGDSMYPRFKAGDIVVCRLTEVSPEEVIGDDAAVQTADGRRYIKTVLRGSAKGMYDLESHNARPIRDVHLLWVSPILATIPARQWRKLDGIARKRLLGQTSQRDPLNEGQPNGERAAPGQPGNLGMSRILPSAAEGIAEHVPRARLALQQMPEKTSGSSHAPRAKNKSASKSVPRTAARKPDDAS